MTNEYEDVPIEELEKRMLAAMDQGFVCYQKWTCAHCKSRQTMDKHNIIYTSGTCGECGKTTEIKEAGFLAVASTFKQFNPEDFK